MEGKVHIQFPCTSVILHPVMQISLKKKKEELVGIMLIWEYHLRTFMRLGGGHGGREEGQTKENRIKLSAIVVNTE